MLREEAIRKHRALWNQIAKDILFVDPDQVYSIEILKQNAMEKLFPKDECKSIMNECYLCEYARGLCPTENVRICNYCPVVSPYSNEHGCLGGLYDRFVNNFFIFGLLPTTRFETIFATRMELHHIAEEIANLPEKEEL